MSAAGPGEAPLPLDALREPDLRRKAEEAFRAAIEAVEPSRLVVRAFQALPTALRQALEVRSGRLVVVGAGKAAGPMAAALEDALAEFKLPKSIAPPPPVEGIVVLKRGATIPRLRRIQVREAAHPLPDEAGAAAAREVLDLVRGLGAGDLVFAALSGGGSALLPLPAEGISLDDLRATTDLLLRAGATIHEMNAVRKHLSALAGGQLARASRASALIAFAISDVPGDRLDSIASGPTVPDETTFRDALAALRKHRLEERVPAAALERIVLGAKGKVPETPKPGDDAFARARTVLIGSNRTALDATANRIAERLPPIVLQGGLSGEARAAGERFARRMLQLKEKAPKALIAGGETTVTVSGQGKGGRNQEFAIGAALVLAGTPGVCLLAGGTDGEDGPTDAAGAVVDGATVPEARAQGLSPEEFLARNDSYRFLDRLGCLLTTGPTGTNVMDVAIGLVAR